MFSYNLKVFKYFIESNPYNFYYFKENLKNPLRSTYGHPVPWLFFFITCAYTFYYFIYTLVLLEYSYISLVKIHYTIVLEERIVLRFIIVPLAV